jgi:hypothetical protein
MIPLFVRQSGSEPGEEIDDVPSTARFRTAARRLDGRGRRRSGYSFVVPIGVTRPPRAKKPPISAEIRG